MADLTPNDLSHLSDEEFLALCPQGEHAPGPEPLSPAAEAVWTAYETADCDPYLVAPRKAGIAATLRAAAHHLQRCSPWTNDDGCIPLDWCTSELHDIATELENAQ